jgi:NADH-quinone oxidoreductase subunit A
MYLILPYILDEFINLCLFGFVAVVLTTVLFSLSIILKPRMPDIEKLSAYECGFQPFSSIKLPFTISYYLIALLFIIFDIELVFCLPLVFVVHSFITFSIMVTVALILSMLVLGLIYEWRVKAMDFILI